MPAQIAEYLFNLNVDLLHVVEDSDKNFLVFFITAQLQLKHLLIKIIFKLFLGNSVFLQLF